MIWHRCFYWVPKKNELFRSLFFRMRTPFRQKWRHIALAVAVLKLSQRLRIGMAVENCCRGEFDVFEVCKSTHTKLFFLKSFFSVYWAPNSRNFQKGGHLLNFQVFRFFWKSCRYPRTPVSLTSILDIIFAFPLSFNLSIFPISKFLLCPALRLSSSFRVLFIRSNL